MYTITKRIEIAGAHKLNLPYESPCCNLHGHNWIIEVEVSGPELLPSGMLIDFTIIKEVVDIFDHQDINTILPEGMSSTAEQMAMFIQDNIQNKINIYWEDTFGPEFDAPDTPIIPQVSKVTVQESEGNKACYIP